MVDNVEEIKGRRMSVKFCYMECLLYGCPLFRGCLRNGRTVGIFESVHHTVMSAIEGCFLSGVPLYALWNKS